MKPTPLHTPHRRVDIEAFIDAFVIDKHYVPPSARPIRSRDELSLAFDQHIKENAPNEAWRAWIDGARVWFVVGRLSLPMTRRLDRPVLQFCFYDMDGNLASSGLWALNESRRWDLCEV